jgi:hypothetical protein
MAVIQYSSTTPFGAMVYAVIRDMKDAQAKLSRVLDMANELTGGGVTLSGLEGTTFGVATGQGPNFYNALASLNSSLFANTASRTPLQATIDLDQGQ